MAVVFYTPIVEMDGNIMRHLFNVLEKVLLPVTTHRSPLLGRCYVVSASPLCSFRSYTHKVRRSKYIYVVMPLATTEKTLENLIVSFLREEAMRMHFNIFSALCLQRTPKPKIDSVL